MKGMHCFIKNCKFLLFLHELISRSYLICYPLGKICQVLSYNLILHEQAGHETPASNRGAQRGE